MDNRITFLYNFQGVAQRNYFKPQFNTRNLYRGISRFLDKYVTGCVFDPTEYIHIYMDDRCDIGNYKS